MKRLQKLAAFWVLASALPMVAVADDPYPPLEACAVEPLVAGGGNFGTLVGRVLANPNGNDLQITFDTTAAPDYDFGPYRGHASIPGDWSITELHVDASCLDSDGNGALVDPFPTNKQGNPTVGKFEVNQKLAGVQSYTATLAGFGGTACLGGSVYVAAHAVVKKAGMSTDYAETAWGVEIPFAALTGAAQWAQFFAVDLDHCANAPDAPPLPPNHVPLANDDAYTFIIGSADNLLVPEGTGLLANDSDQDGQSLKVASVNGTPVPTGGLFVKLPSGGLIVEANGAFTFKPNPGFTGVASFSYTATDGLLTSAPATVKITVATAPVPPPSTPVPAQCSQCSGLDCLLNSSVKACGEGQDLCNTTVKDVNSVRTIERGCGSRTDDPEPAVPSADCRDVETKLLDNSTCKFYCDGVNQPGCNAPPSLLPPVGSRVPAWQ